MSSAQGKAFDDAAGMSIATNDTQLFRDIFDSSPIGIAVENLDGHPLFVNPALCTMLGFSAIELCSKACIDFSPPADAAKDWTFFQQLRTGATDHYQIEKRYCRRDGSLFWGRLTVSLLNNRPSRLVIAMVEDITEKKANEDARFSHAAIIRSSQDAIISTDLDRTIVSWNAGAQLIFEYTEAEAVGQPIVMLYPPEIREAESRSFEKVRSGTAIEHYETVRVTKSGKKVDISLCLCPVLDADNNVAGFTGITHLITERKRAEQLLRQSNEALQKQAAALQQREGLLSIFVRNVPAGVAMLDREMRYLQVSERFCADYSIERSAAIGRSHYELFPDLPESWKEIHRRALHGATCREDEDRWERHEATLWVRWEVRPWRGSDGSIGGILIFAEDITGRKEMEEALSTVTAKMIESQEQERSRIGRELHDDINQRLGLLAIGLDLMKDTPSALVSRSQQLREEVDGISKDVQALSHELHPSKLEYLGVVEGLRSSCDEFSARQAIKVNFASNVSYAVSLPIGLCLLRVLQEALHNAVKHSGAKEMQVELTKHSGAVRLTIKDSGTGFNIEAAKRGSGLGLTSMAERVRAVGGTLDIDSTPLAGTSIVVRIPLIRRSEPNGS